MWVVLDNKVTAKYLKVLVFLTGWVAKTRRGFINRVLGLVPSSSHEQGAP